MYSIITLCPVLQVGLRRHGGRRSFFVLFIYFHFLRVYYTLYIVALHNCVAELNYIFKRVFFKHFFLSFFHVTACTAPTIVVRTCGKKRVGRLPAVRMVVRRFYPGLLRAAGKTAEKTVATFLQNDDGSRRRPSWSGWCNRRVPIFVHRVILIYMYTYVGPTRNRSVRRSD